MDCVVNLVGILNEHGRDGAGFRRAHTELAQTVVAACRSAGVRRLLHMSALKADAARAPSHYLRSKGRAEEIVAHEGAAHIAYTIFRPSVIFGPDDSLTNRFAALLRRLPVLPIGRSEARFAPVYVEDVAQAFVKALENPQSAGATYELCGPDIYSLGEIVRYVRSLLGVPRLIMDLPEPLGRMQAWVGEYLLPGKPISLDNFASLGVASLCSDDGLRRLGIEARALTAIAPTYLGRDTRAGRLARMRQNARGR
jgi:NADH dehydrogenase